MDALRAIWTMIRTALLLSAATCAAQPAFADCDPSAGWPAGTSCTPASRVGVRVGSADKALQTAINDGTIGRGLTARTVTGTATLAASDLAQVNTTSGAFTVTLPSAPSDGAVIEIVDVAGTFDTNGLTISRGGSDTIEGSTTKVVSVEYAYLRLSYDAQTARWHVLDEAGGGGSGDVTQVWAGTSGDLSSLTAASGDTLDAGAGTASSPSTRSTTLPATCLEGQQHQDTDSGDSELYVCTAANTWTKLATVAQAGGGGGGGGVVDAEYLTGAAHGTLTAERVVTNTPTVTWDTSTAGQVKANVAQGAGTDVTADLEEETHASEHQHGGADEIATATPGANAIPKAGAGGTLGTGWLPQNAGTDITADLEEETHASEHNVGGADPVTDVAGARVLNSTTSTISIIREDTTERCWYLDDDRDEERDYNAQEACIVGQADGTFASDRRPFVDHGENYERNGTTTTKGLQEAIDYGETLARPFVVELGPRQYVMTGSTPLTNDASGAPMTLTGPGALVCTTANGCSATEVVRLLVNEARVIGVSINCDTCTGAMVRIGGASNYVSGVVVERNYLDGASALSAGSRQGYGVQITGLENRIVGNQVRWTSTAFQCSANTAQQCNGNTFENNRVTLSDDGFDVSVGSSAANACDAEQLRFQNNFFQSIYRYGVILRGNTGNNLDRCNATFISNWFEGMDSGIVSIGGTGSNNDPDIYSVGNSFSTMADVAGTAGKPDADSVARGIYADSDAHTTIVSTADRFGSSTCIAHQGTGNVYYQADTTIAGPCVPTIGGSAVLRDLDADLAWVDEAVTITGNWVNTANPWADNEVVDTITASNYMPLIGGTFANGGTAPVVVVDDEGAIRFTEEDANGANYQALKGAASLAGDATFSLNISAATCTGDGNGGALTVNGSNEIVCSADDGGAGGSLPVVDTTSIAEGSGDATKEVRFEVDGITTGTVRVLTMPDADVDLGALTASNLAAGSLTAADAAADLATQAELDAKSAATSTDNAVARFDSTAGDIQDSPVTVGDTGNMDGIGTLDADGAVTAPSFTADAVAAPALVLNDSDSASESADAQIAANATDTGAGTEDVDLTLSVQVNSTLTDRIKIDADGQTQVLASALEVDASDPADSGAVRLDNNEGVAWEASPAGTDVVMAADASEIIQITGGTLDAADLSGTAPDASVNGANESDEITGLTDAQISDTLTASTSTTAAANDNDTSIATTAFVQQEIDDGDLLSDNCALENDATPIPDSCVGDGSDAGAGGGAPTTVDYLVGTADAGLSAEIVVGTAPGGELGGTWASPTIDDGITVDAINLTSANIQPFTTTAPAPTAEGDIEWESDDDHLVVGDSVASVEFVPAEDVSGDATMTDAGVVAVADDSHAHTTTTLSGIDMSDDTNLGVGLGLVESGDNVNIDYAQTLAGNPAMNADEAILTTDGAAGACILTEGSTANTNEQKYCLPDQDNADATDFIVTDDADSVTSIDGTGLSVTTGTLNVALSELSAGGELGGTLDAPTIDDSLTVNSWTLDSPTFTTLADFPTVTAFPGSPPTGAVVIVTDDSAIGACDSAAGSARSLCWYNGTGWQSLGDGGGGGGAPSDAEYIVSEANGTLSAEVAPSADDQIPVSDSSTAATWRGLPDSDGATQKLQYDQATNAFSAGTDDDVPESGDFGAIDTSAELRGELTDENGTGAALFAGATYVDSLYIPAGSMDVDGTQCQRLAPTVINSGPMIVAINCADNAAGIVYFDFNMPDGWGNSGIITVEAQAYTVDATISGGADDTVGWDVSCMARGDGETINSTWGTAQNLDVTFATQYVEEHVTSSDITPGDFEAGDTLYCRAVIDTTTTDATTADMRLNGFKVEFTRAIGD